MKKNRNIIVVALILMFSGCSFGNENVVANIDDEVIACFNEVNAFRTGDEAWYWNEDDSAKIDFSGNLDELILDEELCRAAQIRANEIVKKFDHTRPNGSSCFTVLKDCGIVYSSTGENIAAGNKTGIATFLQWKEDGKAYSGQGHRRNMLGNFKKIGIAYAYDEKSTYKYYWTMILTK